MRRGLGTNVWGWRGNEKFADCEIDGRRWLTALTALASTDSAWLLKVFQPEAPALEQMWSNSKLAVTETTGSILYALSFFLSVAFAFHTIIMTWHGIMTSRFLVHRALLPNLFQSRRKYELYSQAKAVTNQKQVKANPEPEPEPNQRTGTEVEWSE